MKTAKEYSDTAKREVSVDVDALLAAINEISESEVHRSQNDSEGTDNNAKLMSGMTIGENQMLYVCLRTGYS